MLNIDRPSLLSHHLRRLAISAVTLAIVAASCSSDSSDGVDAAATAVQADVSESSDAPEAAEPDADGADEEPQDQATLAEFPQRMGELRSFRASAMGGVAFDVALGDEVLLAGDSVVVSDRTVEEFGPSASVGLVSQLTSGEPISTIDDFVDAVESVPGASVEESGTVVELLGYELIGYRTEAPIASADAFLFASERFGSPVQSGSAPFPLGLTFVAETPVGLLMAGVRYFEPDEVSAIEETFGTLLSSVKFTGSGLDDLDETEPISDPEVSGEPAPAIEAPAGSPPLLGAPFVPVDPGSYLVANFGRPLVVDVPENWSVQPNFPGFVVLTATGSIGPGDRDLVMVNGVVSVTPTSGPAAAGETIELADIDAFLDTPPSAIVVSDVQRTEIDGTAVVRFDVSANPDAECSTDDPCDVTFRTNYGADKATQSTQRHRIWWIEEHPNGPAMIVAMDSLDGTFIEEATVLMDGARFLD